MTERTMVRLAGWLLACARLLMPREQQEWLQAMAAELDYIPKS